MKKVIPKDAVLVPEQAECTFQGMIFDVYQWEQELFDGSTHTFEMLKRTDTVTVICVVDGKILVLEDEQPHLGMRRNFPGGRVDDTDASMQAAAQREVLEETGYSFANWKLVKVSQPYRKIEWFVHVFVATDVINRQEPKLDPGEKITIEPLSFEEVKTLAMDFKDHLSESRDLFGPLSGLDEVVALPEFVGQTVDR